VPSVVLIVPGSLDTRTGGYGYDRRIVSGLRERGWSVDVRELDGSYPFPTPRAQAGAAAALGSLPDGALVLADGLAYGAMADEARVNAGRLRIVALVHHPLAEESGLDAATALALAASERDALRSARQVVVTSRRTAALLPTYGVTPDRITVVEPGTDPAPLARGSQSGTTHLLCVATLTPRKGHLVLLRALSQIAHLPWHLTCLGGAIHAETARQVEAAIAALGLGGRVTLAGEGDDRMLAEAYDRADVFVLPTLYEGYGMVVAEALARGLPVIGTSTGAIADLVGHDAGIVVPPGNERALAGALELVLQDGPVRARLASGAQRARLALPTWADAAARMADVLTKVEADGVLR
jgi:glycosyltransferase involved in cell wall biosynthesis